MSEEAVKVFKSALHEGDPGIVTQELIQNEMRHSLKPECIGYLVKAISIVRDNGPDILWRATTFSLY
jgi:hypothetical protein